MKIREKTWLAIDIHKISNYILHLPICNNMAMWKEKTCHPTLHIQAEIVCTMSPLQHSPPPKPASLCSPIRLYLSSIDS
jgi:hypothetical protein